MGIGKEAGNGNYQNEKNYRIFIVALVMITLSVSVLPIWAAELNTGTEAQSEESEAELHAEEAEDLPEIDAATENAESVCALENAEAASEPIAVSAAENGIPALHLTIDPDEFQRVLDSPDHSYRAYEGTVRFELPEGYTGEFGSIDPSGIDKELALEFIRGTCIRH